jgi:hypothetical protein
MDDFDHATLRALSLIVAMLVGAALITGLILLAGVR